MQINLKKCFLSIFAVFAFIFVFDFIVHGFLLKDTYMQTQSLWRPESEGMMWVMFASQFLYATFVTSFFIRLLAGRSKHVAIHFGFYLGIIVAAMKLGVYAYMPLPFMLVASWMFAAFLLNLGIGFILSFTYKTE